MFLIFFNCLDILPVEAVGDEDLERALALSRISYEQEEKCSAPSRAGHGDQRNRFSDQPRHDGQYDYKQSSEKLLLSTSTADFFFSPDWKNKREFSCDELLKAAPHLMVPVTNLYAILRRPDWKIDTEKFRKNAGKVMGEYKKFTDSEAYKTIWVQEGMVKNLDESLEPIIGHPSIAIYNILSKEKLPLLWHDIIPLIFKLSKLRKKARSGRCDAVDTNADPLHCQVTRFVNYMETSSDLDEKLLKVLDPVREDLSGVIAELGSRAHWEDPTNYPPALDTLSSTLRKHGQRIIRAELKISPKDAIAESVFKALWLIWHRRSSSSQRLDNPEDLWRDWSREEKHTFVENFLGRGSLDMILRSIVEQNYKYAITSGNQQSIAQSPQNDLAQRQQQQIVRRDVHCESECDLSDVIVEMHPHVDQIYIGDIILTMPDELKLLVLGEIVFNLRELIKRPPATHSVHIRDIGRHVKRQLALAEEEQGYLRVYPQQMAIASGAFGEQDLALRSSAYQGGLLDPSYQMPW